ncbi:MAG: hypothetical protein KF892_23835 [Rhizobacter sp.]|nr:hypothetical protein [Rhizobacter sp.]
MTSVQHQQNLRARTDAKLVYAELHLAELVARGGNGGTDFDRAFQESFLFHLLGALESFLIELNEYYKVGLPITGVSKGKLRNALKQRGEVSAELAELFKLEQDKASWLSHAKEMRDHSAHVFGFPRAYHMGGPNSGKVFLRNPATGDHVEFHVVDTLTQWLQAMRVLLNHLRSSAIATNAL